MACKDMQGYSCTRLHNLNRPRLHLDTASSEQRATCSCHVSKLKHPRDSFEIPNSQSPNSQRTDRESDRKREREDRPAYQLQQTVAIPHATCHNPQQSDGHTVCVQYQQQFINLFTSSRRQFP